MSEVEILFRATADPSGLDALFDRLTPLKEKTKEVGEQGFGALAKGAADAVMGIRFFTNELQASAGMIDSVNKLGVESLRARDALNALAGTGQATTYINAMRTSTHGLVDDMTLAEDATRGYSEGLARTSKDMAELARIGATLGLVFKGDAQEGIASLLRLLDQPGNKRGLQDLGLNADAVISKFNSLKKELGDGAAWKLSVMDDATAKADKLAPTLDGVGTHLERLKAGFGSWAQGVAENVATSVDYLIRFGEVIDEVSRRGGGGRGNGLNIPSNPLQMVGAANSPGLMMATGDINDPLGLKGGRGGGAGFQFNSAPNYGEMANIIQGYRSYNYGAIASGGDMGMAGLGVYGIPRPDYDPNKRNAPSYLTPDWMGHEDSYNDAVRANRRTSAVGVETRLHGEGERQAGEIALAAEKQSYLNSLAVMGRNIFNDMAGAAGKVVGAIGDASQAQLKADADLKRRTSGIYGAFDITPDGLSGQLGAGMGSDFDAAQKAFDKKQKRLGKKGADAMDDFDEAKQAALDHYALATGRANEGMIAMERVQRQLGAAVRDGKMSMMEEALALEDLDRRLKAGKNSAQDMYAVMERAKERAMLSDATQGHDRNGRSTAKGVDATNLKLALQEDEAGQSAANASDPYGPAAKSADKLTSSQDKASTASSNMANTIFDSSQKAASSFNPIIAKAVDAHRQIDAVSKALWGMAGDLAIHIGFSVGGGDGRNSVRPVSGPQ